MNPLSLKFYFNDSFAMLQRSLKHIFRNLDVLLISIFLPIMIMLLFVFVFGGAIDTGTKYVNYIVPGVIITCVGYSSSMIAITVCQDMVGGLFQRFRSLPIHPVSFLTGHVIGSFVRNSISTLLVFGVAFLIGFKPNATFLNWLAVIALLSLFLLAISWLSIIFGLLAKSVETASAFSFVIMFLPYVSSAFVPTETMPSWLHSFAAHQPMTPLIETLRGLLSGTSTSSHSLLAISWFASILIISFLIAVTIYRKRLQE